MEQGGMLMNKITFSNLIAICLMLVGCTTKQQTPTDQSQIEVDTRYEFISKINDLKLQPRMPSYSQDTYYYRSQAFNGGSSYSCEIFCQYDNNVSIFDIYKPSRSSFKAEFSNRSATYPVYASRSGASDGENLVFQREYNDGLSSGGVPHETQRLYVRANYSLRYDLDFDYASFQIIDEYISLCKSKESIQNGVIEDETTRYYIDIYPEDCMISCYATRKEGSSKTRTNLFFWAKNGYESDELFVAVIACDIYQSYLQTITFTTGNFRHLVSIDDFEINPDATLYPYQELIDKCFSQEINAYVSREELIHPLNHQF